MSRKQYRPRTIAREIARKLDIGDDDVIVIKKETDIGDSIRIFNSLRLALNRSGRENCVVMVLDNFDDIMVMKEAEMKSYGWCRCPQASLPTK